MYSHTMEENITEQEEWISSCYNYMDRSHTNVQGKKPDTKVYKLYAAMCMSLNMLYFNKSLTKKKKKANKYLINTQPWCLHIYNKNPLPSAMLLPP